MRIQTAEFSISDVGGNAHITFNDPKDLGRVPMIVGMNLASAKNLRDALNLYIRDAVWSEKANG